MPHRPEDPSDPILPAIEQEVANFAEAVKRGDAAAQAAIVGRVAALCGLDRALVVLLGIAGRYLAERAVVQAALNKKTLILESLLAAPRRIAKVVGLIRETSESGEEVTWAVLQGPPPQAVRFQAELAPQEVCSDDPDEPVWVWLAESADGLAIVGKIEPPRLLHASVEREMVFEGFVEEEKETDGSFF